MSTGTHSPRKQSSYSRLPLWHSAVVSIASTLSFSQGQSSTWESLRQADTPSPGPTRSFERQSKRRNALHRTITDNRAEYLEACAATRKFSEEARLKKWEEFLADLENNPDPGRTWRTIKSLPRTPSATTFSEPLLHIGRTFNTNAFMKEYAAVNRFTQEERNRIRQLKSTLKSPTAGESCCAGSLAQLTSLKCSFPHSVSPPFKRKFFWFIAAHL